jgi:hypothetical protein
MTAAFILAIIKAVPAAEQILQQLIELYVSWKKESNRNETKSKDARDDADIDVLARRVSELCPSCPFAGICGGQHGSAQAASGVQGSGDSRT